MPGATGRIVPDAIIVNVAREDWDRIPSGSYEIPGVMLGVNGNGGGPLEFRSIIVRAPARIEADSARK